jgi:hypothetical protein
MIPEGRLERHEQWLEQHERAIAEHDRMMAEHGRGMAEHRLNMAEHERTMRRIDERLDRAVRLSVREARSERIKRRELDDKITQLAAAQLVTEEKLQGLIEALKRAGNGHARLPD